MGQVIEFGKWIVGILGIGGSFAVVLGWLWKQMLSPVYNGWLDYKKTKATTKINADLEEKKAQLQSLINTQLEIHKKNLEIEAVKLNKVLPVLEEINLALSNHLLLFSTYLQHPKNKSFPETWEKIDRLSYDQQLIERIPKVSIYLPREMRLVLRTLRNIVSCSFRDKYSIYLTLDQDGFNVSDVVHRALDVYQNYLDCFYEMVSRYCSIISERVDYKEILSKYGFTEDAKLKDDDRITHAAMGMYLYHEFVRYNPEKYDDETSLMELITRKSQNT